MNILGRTYFVWGTQDYHGDNFGEEMIFWDTDTGEHTIILRHW